MALLAPRLVGPLARFVGLPARTVGGVAGELAGANAVRNPGRTASTAAALMIGLTLVTARRRARLEHDEGERLGSVERGGARGLRHRRQGRHAVPRRRRRRAGAGRGRRARLARPLGHRARGRQGDARSPASTRPRSPASSTFTWVKGSEGSLAKLGTDGAIVTREYANAAPPGDRRHARHHDAVGREAHARRPRHPQPEDAAAGRDQHEPEGLRRRLRRRAEERAHVHRRRPRPRARRSKPKAGGFGDATFHAGGAYAKDATQGHGEDARDALRAARLLRDRQPVRDGQHPRALGVRAHAGDRHAAHDRHDPPPDAADDPAREHHHGADRCRARPRPRHGARRRWSWPSGTCRSRCRSTRCSPSR